MRMMCFFEHELNEYNEFTMRMSIFILPQIADEHGFFYENIEKHSGNICNM